MGEEILYRDKIMIIEDEKDITNIIETGLQEKLSRPFEIFSFDNAEDAFTSFHKVKYDLIITDFHLPGMDGFSFINRIREFDKKIPIIFDSGFFTELELAKHAESFDNVTFLDKPFSIKKLTNVVKIILYAENNA